jgi:hypothetical protein
MEETTFQSRSATRNLKDNPSLSQFIVNNESGKGWSGNTPHGYNAGASSVTIKCICLYEDKHIRFPDGEIRWADIYQTPDGDLLAVRQLAGNSRQIAKLEFYKKQDFNFEVLLDYNPNTNNES